MAKNKTANAIFAASKEWFLIASSVYTKRIIVNPQQMMRLYLTDDVFRSNLYPQWKYFSTNFNIAS